MQNSDGLGNFVFSLPFLSFIGYKKRLVDIFHTDYYFGS